jgi:hypothetical protein
MPFAPLLVAITLTLAPQVAGGRVPTPTEALAMARQAYNAGRWDDALGWLAHARRLEPVASSAELVFARVTLERFRIDGDVEAVALARLAVRAIDPAQLTDGERQELRLATGGLLFAEEQFGVAAEVFEGVLAEGPPASDRERIFEWWAASLDRHAQLAPDGERQRWYRRLLEGVNAERRAGARTPTVVYWHAASLRGVDDLDRAWSVAVSGWIEAAQLEAVRRDSLRADLDRLIREAIVPERARLALPPADPAAVRASLVEQWEALKSRWGGVPPAGSVM